MSRLVKWSLYIAFCICQSFTHTHTHTHTHTPQATLEQDTSEAATTKNYVLYADSEEEMKEWIEALTEEIKPMIGENR